MADLDPRFQAVGLDVGPQQPKTDFLRLHPSEPRTRPHPPHRQQADRPDSCAQIQMLRHHRRNLERIPRGQHVIDRVTVPRLALGDQPARRSSGVVLQKSPAARKFPISQ